MPDVTPLDTLVRAHRAVRQTVAALAKTQRPAAFRAAAVATGNEAAVSLSIALITRAERRERAVADARDDLKLFLAHLRPDLDAPVRRVLSELQPH